MGNFTVGQVLTAAEMNDLDERPSCRVYRTASYSNAVGTTTLCPYDTVSWDTASGFSLSTHLYTVPENGYYLVSGGWGRSASNIDLAIYQNGSAVAKGHGAYNTSGVPVSQVVDVVKCNAGDTLACYYTDAGGGTTFTDGAINRMSITKLASL